MILIFIIQLLVSGGAGVGVLTSYVPLFLADALKVGVFERGVIFTIGLCGGVVGPVYLGKYADKVGFIKIAIYAAIVASALIFLLSLYQIANLILVIHLFLLIFVSFSFPTMLQLHLVEVAEGYRRDVIIGTFFATTIGFSSLWIIILANVIDFYSSFDPAFVLMGIQMLLALAILTYLYLHETHQNH
jgi:MFS family permease